jgi:clan AA aspartic protease (TIGR02281 family)
MPFLLWTAILGGLFAAASQLAPSSPGGRISQLCFKQDPPTGAFSKSLDPSVMKRSDATYSSIEFTNHHPQKIAAFLTEPGTPDKRILLAHIPYGETVTVSAPVRDYGLYFEYGGSHWCGEAKGYSDGQHVRINGNFPNQHGKIGRVEFRHRDGDPRPAVSYAHTDPPLPPPDFRITGGDHYIDLPQGPRGHYQVDGTILGTHLSFLIDTGATLTAVSQEFASRAGITSCRPISSKTANGVTNACLATVSELSFGPFSVANVEVSILPRLEGSEALLGMNVLRRFSIEQQNRVMRISGP